MEEETDGQRLPAAEIALDEEKFKKLEMEADLRLKEDTIRDILSPHEGTVMSFQGLLVWENPRRSFVLLLCVNGFVWLMVTSNYNIVFKATLSVITIVTVQTFYKKVWPDIKVEPTVPVEGWVPLDPELVQFHDLCHYAAVTWQYSLQKHRQFWNLRKEKPGRFCLLVFIVCLGTFLFGLRVSGAVATYLLASSLVIVPGIVHRNLHQHLYSKMRPYLVQMEHSMEADTKRKKKRGRQRSSKQKTADTDEADYSSSDSELDDFIPSPGPALDAAFAHAAAPYEKTPGSSSRVTPVSGLVGGLMPKGASLELTDDDGLTDNENNSLAFGPIEGIPAYDESDSLRLRRPKPVQRTSLRPPPPPAYRPRELPLTHDMSETHFQTIPANDFSNGSEPFSSEEDMLDTSPDAVTEDMFDDDNVTADDDPPRVLPEIHEPVQYSEAPQTQQSTPESTESSGALFTPPLLVDEPTQEPSLLPKAAADLLSQTVASVTALIGRDRTQSPGAVAAATPSSREAAHHDSGPSSMDPDISEYEMLDGSEIDNERNSRTESEAKDNSISEFFSNIFGRKT